MPNNFQNRKVKVEYHWGKESGGWFIGLVLHVPQDVGDHWRIQVLEVEKFCAGLWPVGDILSINPMASSLEWLRLLPEEEQDEQKF